MYPTYRRGKLCVCVFSWGVVASLILVILSVEFLSPLLVPLALFTQVLLILFVWVVLHMSSLILLPIQRVEFLGIVLVRNLKFNLLELSYCYG